MRFRDRWIYLLLGALGVASMDCGGIGSPGHSDAELTVTHRGVLYGRVLGPGGEPAAYVHVVLGSYLPGASQEQGVRAEAMYAIVDTSGRYRMYFDAGLPDSIPVDWYLEIDVEGRPVYYRPETLKVNWLGQPIDMPLDSLEVDFPVDTIPG